MTNQTKINISTEIVISDESSHVVSVVTANNGIPSEVLNHHLNEASRIISANLMDRLPHLADAEPANDQEKPQATVTQARIGGGNVTQLGEQRRKTRSDAGKPRKSPTQPKRVARAPAPTLSGMSYKKSDREDIINLREKLREMDVKTESNKKMPLPSTKALEIYIDTKGNRDEFMKRMEKEGYSDVTARQGWFRATAYIPTDEFH